jgi:hypothetical protein
MAACMLGPKPCCESILSPGNAWICIKISTRSSN